MVAPLSNRLEWSGYLLGFSLGGFFDGILLHQILQWHHLLSAVERDVYSDIKLQILADGLFHAVMYVIALFGLWLLWRSRQEFSVPQADRALFARVLIGFGGWHIVDTIFSHWLIGIHRIKMGSSNPLLWDLTWFLVFGVLPIIAGVIIRRKTTIGGRSHGQTAACLLGASVLIGGAAAALPPPNISQVMVYFGPKANPHAVLNAAAAIDARVIWSDRSAELWAFDLGDRSRSIELYRHGAWFVGSTFLSLGCLSWSRAV
jgi:uncharacterized membrane protein